MISCYIRPLEEVDALTSYKWRNNPAVWEHTGSRPDIVITHAIELDWIKKVLLRKGEQRFAICDKEFDTYIGNVQLTNILDGVAEFHIFIGDTTYWGKGVGYQATELMLDHARNILKLEEIYLWVSSANTAALKIYERYGFKRVKEDAEQLKMSISLIG